MLAHTTSPSAHTIEDTAEILSKLSRKVEAEYNTSNSYASKYFSFLEKEAKAHEAFLHTATKKYDKAEKAYRKASKSFGHGYGHGSAAASVGDMHALKASLGDDLTKANQ